MTTLGTLSIHLDGAPCRVGCAWCYLGRRVGDPAETRPDHVHLPVLAEALGRLRYDEVAVAVSEPLEEALPRLRAVVAAARAPVAVTTTPQLARRAPPALLDGVARLSLSIDSHKGVVEPARVGCTCRPAEGGASGARGRPSRHARHARLRRPARRRGAPGRAGGAAGGRQGRAHRAQAAAALVRPALVDVGAGTAPAAARRRARPAALSRLLRRRAPGRHRRLPGPGRPVAGRARPRVSRLRLPAGARARRRDVDTLAAAVTDYLPPATCPFDIV